MEEQYINVRDYRSLYLILALCGTMWRFDRMLKTKIFHTVGRYKIVYTIAQELYVLE